MFVGQECIGIVYRKEDGTTFTEWFHKQGYPTTWSTTPEIWVKDHVFFHNHYVPGRYWPRMMAVVRSK